MHEKVIEAIPQATSDHMLEVVLIDDQGQGPRVELRTLAWETAWAGIASIQLR